MSSDIVTRIWLVNRQPSVSELAACMAESGFYPADNRPTGASVVSKDISQTMRADGQSLGLGPLLLAPIRVKSFLTSQLISSEKVTATVLSINVRQSQFQIPLDGGDLVWQHLAYELAMMRFFCQLKADYGYITSEGCLPMAFLAGDTEKADRLELTALGHNQLLQFYPINYVSTRLLDMLPSVAQFLSKLRVIRLDDESVMLALTRSLLWHNLVAEDDLATWCGLDLTWRSTSISSGFELRRK